VDGGRGSTHVDNLFIGLPRGQPKCRQ
jgi:hypothetical protein